MNQSLNCSSFITSSKLNDEMASIAKNMISSSSQYIKKIKGYDADVINKEKAVSR
jgi:hypothetical protein